MAIRTYKVTLDSKNAIAPEPVYLRQGDKTGAVVIDATLMDNGAPVSLDGLTPMFKANTADGKAVIADSTGFNIVNASGGEFTYQVPSQLGSVPGKIKIAYFSFTDSSGNQSTFDIMFAVYPAADMTKESAKDWISNLNEIINQYNQWVNDAHSSWADFVNANKKIIESIDPGGTLLAEIIDARNPSGGSQFSSLADYLQSQEKITLQTKARQQFDDNHAYLWDKLAIHAWDGISFADPLFAKVVANIKAMGITKWRWGIDWAAKYKSNPDGNYDFSYDKGIAQKMIAAGITPIIYVQGIPSGISYQDFVSGAKDFVVKAVKALAGIGVIWESWNEPNIGFWDSWSNSQSTIQDWVNVDNAMGAAVRTYDPGSIFLVGAFSLSTDYKDNSDLYADWGTKVETAVKLGILKYADAVSVHPYQLTAPPEDLLSVNRNIDRMKAIIAKYTRSDIPVVVSGFGYSTTNGSSNNPIDESTQAMWLTRAIFILDYMNVPLITIFAYLVNTDATDNAEYGFGIYRKDGTTQKPAATMLSSILSQLNGYKLVERIKGTGNSYYFMRYANDDNDSKVVYWHDDAVADVTVNIDGKPLSVSNSPQIIDGSQYDSSSPLKYSGQTQALISETFGALDRTVRELPAGTDLNNVLDQGTYILGSNDYQNLPRGNGYGILKVSGSTGSIGRTDVIQTVYHTWEGDNPILFRTRHNSSGAWHKWLNIASSAINSTKTYTSFTNGTGTMIIRIIASNTGAKVDVSFDLKGLGADITLATIWSGTQSSLPLPFGSRTVWFTLRDPNNHANGRVFYLGLGPNSTSVITSNAVIGSPTSSTNLKGTISYRSSVLL